MITITYHKEYNRLTMEGHAGSGEPGNDLVCAAASAICYTLAANVQHMEEQGILVDATADLNPGMAEISCKSNRRFKSMVELVFNSICMGFGLLAEQYPDNVKFIVFG